MYKLFFSGLFFISTFSFSQTDSKPKLVVGIVVDQMCYDYLYRFENKLSDKGFLKLLRQGVSCENTHYNYVPTYTGPGHASIYTGTTPNNHGIVGNEWYHRGLKREINCVEDTSVFSIGTTSAQGKFSPKNLVAYTITDQLKLTHKNSKVVSVSIKNRSAILPGGHLSDGSYWFDNTNGNFITSSYFKQKLPLWVYNFNEQHQVQNYLKQTWKTILPIDQYNESEKDNSPYEVVPGNKKTPEFPYNLAEMSVGATNLDLFVATPFANTYLTDFAISALEEEEMGLDDTPDFLAISYSTPDIVGHSFGPYSIEIEDIYLRLDFEIEKLIDVLEARIGKENFVLFLTADHAVVPVPQYLTDKKLPGGYVFMEPIFKELNTLTQEKFGQALVSEMTNSQIYLDTELMRAKNIEPNTVYSLIKGHLAQQKGIKNVYSVQELSESSSDNWKEMLRLGHRPYDSGDLFLLLEPGYLPKTLDKESAHKGTSHGSAFNYDTHVPLIWYGKNIKHQKIYRRVNITDITATLAPLLQLQRPNMTTGEPIIEILK